MTEEELKSCTQQDRWSAEDRALLTGACRVGSQGWRYQRRQTEAIKRGRLVLVLLVSAIMLAALVALGGGF